nr:winged helix-turn-helix domain-containing protein [Pyrinomonadaceae bacterium]
MKQVWPETYVEENNLQQSISALRKVLEDGAGESRYIETVPRRGYRFTARVEEYWDDKTESALEDHTSSSGVKEEQELSTLPTDGGTSDTTTRPLPLVSKIKSHWRSVGLAMAALTIAASAVFYFRFSIQPAPALTDRDTILLADFINTTGDPTFDETLKQALAVHLEQTPFLNLLPDERVRETLRYMNRSPDELVTKTVAREICVRQNLKAVLGGTIAGLGKHYVITLEAANGSTGEVIAREQVEVESKEQVLRALGQAAFRLREKLGESLRSIQQYNTPIEQATTSSLEALKAYSLGVQQSRRSQWREAIPFLKRAVELDPDFAIAYSELALAHANSMRPITAKEFGRKAFELRERTTERERFEIAVRYYRNVTYERDKADEVFEIWRQTYPRDLRAQEGLANHYLQRGQPEKSLEICRELVRLHPDYSGAYSTLAIALIRLNRYAEAKEVLEGALARGLGWRSIHFYLYQIAFVQGDEAAMKQQINWAASQPYDYDALTWPADAAAFSGQLRRTRELYRRAIDLADRRRDHEAAVRLMGFYVIREATLGNCQPIIKDTAKNVIAAGNYLRHAAHALALCRELDQARSLINR